MDRVTQLKQEIFNQVYAGAAAQNFEPSFIYVDQEVCAYRGAEGRRCNVGLLIPDERYNPAFEGKGILDGLFDCTTAYDECKSQGFDTEDQAEILLFLSHLQEAHDGCAMSTPANTRHQRNLLEIAKDEGLMVPALPEAA